MRTYKIAAGAIRNSRARRYALGVVGEDEATVFIPNLANDATVVVLQKTIEGGQSTVVKMTLGDLLARAAGL